MTSSLKYARRGQVSPFIVMNIMREKNRLTQLLTAEGRPGIIDLAIGQPSTPAPQPVRDAARHALDTTLVAYTEALGTQELRIAIAQHYRDWYGVDADPARIVVTMGASGAFMLAFLAAFDAGARVGVVTPGYPAYRNILQALDIEAVEIRVTAEDNFQPTPAILQRVPGKLDGLILANPGNPTGTVLDAPGLAAIVDWCAEHQVRLISDEIYHGLTYGMAAPTAAGIAPDALIINSFSKYFCMTGWRLGWMIVPEDLIGAAENLATNIAISAPTLSQIAAVAAFDSYAECDVNIRRYARNRDILTAGLSRIGFGRFIVPQGAFYLYADVGEFTNDSLSFSQQLLEEAGVATAPGIDFDPLGGRQAIRFSFAGSSDDIDEGLRRLEMWRQR